MVIMTAKVSKRKILLIGLLIILAVVVLITCLKKSSGSDTPPDTAEEITEVATNEARVAFLEQFVQKYLYIFYSKTLELTLDFV